MILKEICKKNSWEGENTLMVSNQGTFWVRCFMPGKWDYKYKVSVDHALSFIDGCDLPQDEKERLHMMVWDADKVRIDRNIARRRALSSRF